MAESSRQADTRPNHTNDSRFLDTETNQSPLNPNIASSSGTRDRNENLDNLPLQDKRLKVSNFVNFSNFAVRRSTTGMGIQCKNSDNSNAAEMSHNKIIPESYTQGMSLRKWLNQSLVEVNKAERLQIYRQVVKVVDVAHSQGNALRDLWLSSFILLPSNEIIYIDSDSSTVIDQNNRKHVSVELEKNWYSCPEKLYGRDLLSANVYSLGILLFELLCSFVSLEMHCAAMTDLHNRILPPSFITENPQEAGFCLWLIHPQPSSRPTTRTILQSELLSGTKESYSKSTHSSIIDKNKDGDFDILREFLISLKEEKEKHALKLCENIKLLETDLKNFQHEKVMKILYDSNILDTKMKTYISQLESAYFSKKSQLQLPETLSDERNDLELLGNRESIQEKYVGCIDDFLNGVCKFIRYSKFEVSGTLEMGDLLNSGNVVICSLSFDRDENYIAAAGISKKIKIFEFDSLLHDSNDVNYPAVELLNKSKFSCVCWNKYLKSYLASADYDGVVKVWDAFTGQGLSSYVEHQRRAWCVDFSHVNPTQFASGSDDCSVKLWNLNEKNSTSTIKSGANVCCVQFSSYSSHLLAFGSADYKINCYDLRHTRIPWCTLAGHQKAVSYVKFLGSDSLVSASTDNTLKLWDLKKTSLEGISNSALCMTYMGHTNQKNFVGLSVLDGYIACGSESNEVYAYHKSFSMPIISHKFGCMDPITGVENDDENAHFVSSVCWREKSNMIIAANSGGTIKVLKML